MIESCEIVGSSDSSIRNVVPAKLEKVLESCEIKNIYANGGTEKNYMKSTAWRKQGGKFCKMESPAFPFEECLQMAKADSNMSVLQNLNPTSRPARESRRGIDQKIRQMSTAVHMHT